MNRKLIVGILIEKKGKLLMHKRGYEPSKNKIDFVGGYVDEGEDIKTAAIREAKEETGFDIKLIEEFLIEDYFDRKEKKFHMYIAKIIR